MTKHLNKHSCQSASWEISPIQIGESSREKFKAAISSAKHFFEGAQKIKSDKWDHSWWIIYRFIYFFKYVLLYMFGFFSIYVKFSARWANCIITIELQLSVIRNQTRLVTNPQLHPRCIRVSMLSNWIILISNGRNPKAPTHHSRCLASAQWQNLDTNDYHRDNSLNFQLSCRTILSSIRTSQVLGYWSIKALDKPRKLHIRCRLCDSIMHCIIFFFKDTN